ncbi:hypothetical protein BJ508DRAFT_375741 [Ascobolus immersus RN42]|uniref:Uncharacterized protein n=1 Tax=Ascobolus immersus RN42 TaxID=1160509 RepID=A0A3N4IEC7_ASCIM|nr:hypothetical protein BJ508DRAFT_375741 [Ascobolus immersus RN42]
MQTKCCAPLAGGATASGTCVGFSKQCSAELVENLSGGPESTTEFPRPASLERHLTSASSNFNSPAIPKPASQHLNARAHIATQKSAEAKSRSFGAAMQTWWWEVAPWGAAPGAPLMMG